jgi:uncharacterized protein
MSRQGFLDSVARQARLPDDVARRPWPLPERPWAQAQTREDVLFCHWPVPLDEVARLLPPELAADTFAGEAWLGIVAFRLSHLRLRGLLPLPGLASVLQLEVQLYVTLDDRPGTWLCSLDSGKRALVEAAKRAHRLPAYRARIETGADGDAVRFEVERDGLAFRARYTPAGQASIAAPGTLDHFLCERYRLYTADGGRLYAAELHQAPWRLQPAAATVEAASVAPVALEGEPRLRFSAAHELLVWPLEEL